MKLIRSDWKVVSTGGAEITVSALRFLAFGGTVGNVNVQRSTGPVTILDYAGAGPGANISWKYATPWSVSASPVGTSGTVFRNASIATKLTLDSFIGPCLITVASGAFAFGSIAHIGFLFGGPKQLSMILRNLRVLLGPAAWGFEHAAMTYLVKVCAESVVPV